MLCKKPMIVQSIRPLHMRRKKLMILLSIHQLHNQYMLRTLFQLLHLSFFSQLHMRRKKPMIVQSISQLHKLYMLYFHVL